MGVGSPPHTVEMWFYSTAFPAPGTVSGLMNLGSGDNNVFWNIHSWQGEDIHKAWLETRLMGGGTSLDLPLDTWVHLASSFDGKTLTLCVNGKPVLQPQDMMIDFQKTRLLIGLATDNPAINFGRFEGGIGQVRVWNRARTAGEIGRDMSARLSGQEDGLVLLWRMEEGRGNLLRDASGHGNDGQIIGGAIWPRLSSIEITVDPAKP